MLPHAGTDTRIWREVVALGETLDTLQPVKGSTVDASVAILWDIESFWAQDLEWRPSVELDHRERIEAFYTTLWNRGVTIDFAHPHDDLSRYSAVLAPSQYLVDERSAANIRDYVAGGGTIVVSYFSGVVDGNDAVHDGPPPGGLRDVLGLTIPEFLPFYENQHVLLESGAVAHTWADEIVVGSAEVVTRFVDGPAASGPAITRNRFGAGEAWYISTRLLGDDLDSVLATALESAGVRSEPVAHPGLEVVTRQTDDESFTFYINHSPSDARVTASGVELVTGETVSASLVVPAGDVRVVRNGVA
jgi:beta-galactosidase